MKRFFDFLLVILAIVVLSPVFIAIILVIRFKQGRPIFFTQKRLGLNAKVFNIYKFRTMTTGAHLVRDGLQVTSNTCFESRKDATFNQFGCTAEVISEVFQQASQ